MTVHIPNVGTVSFPATMSLHEVEQEAAKLYFNSLHPAATGSAKPEDTSSREPLQFFKMWQFTVHQRVNRIKLTGVIIAFVVGSVLLIQGLISMAYWIVQGFKVSPSGERQ